MPCERLILAQDIPASKSFTISSVSDEAGLSVLENEGNLPKSANDLGFAFGEVDLCEDVLSADFLKLLILLFFFLFLFFLLFVFKNTALGALSCIIAALVSPTVPRYTSNYVFIILLILMIFVRIVVRIGCRVRVAPFICIHHFYFFHLKYINLLFLTH